LPLIIFDIHTSFGRSGDDTQTAQTLALAPACSGLSRLAPLFSSVASGHADVQATFSTCQQSAGPYSRTTALQHRSSHYSLQKEPGRDRWT